MTEQESVGLALQLIEQAVVIAREYGQPTGDQGLTAATLVGLPAEALAAIAAKTAAANLLFDELTTKGTTDEADYPNASETQGNRHQPSQSR